MIKTFVDGDPTLPSPTPGTILSAEWLNQAEDIRHLFDGGVPAVNAERFVTGSKTHGPLNAAIAAALELLSDAAGPVVLIIPSGEWSIGAAVDFHGGTGKILPVFAPGARLVKSGDGSVTMPRHYLVLGHNDVFDSEPGFVSFPAGGSLPTLADEIDARAAAITAAEAKLLASVNRILSRGDTPAYASVAAAVSDSWSRLDTAMDRIAGRPLAYIHPNSPPGNSGTSLTNLLGYTIPAGTFWDVGPNSGVGSRVVIEARFLIANNANQKDLYLEIGGDAEFFRTSAAIGAVCRATITKGSINAVSVLVEWWGTVPGSPDEYTHVMKTILLDPSAPILCRFRAQGEADYDILQSWYFARLLGGSIPVNTGSPTS